MVNKLRCIHSTNFLVLSYIIQRSRLARLGFPYLLYFYWQIVTHIIPWIVLQINFSKLNLHFKKYFTRNKMHNRKQLNLTNGSTTEPTPPSQFILLILPFILYRNRSQLMWANTISIRFFPINKEMNWKMKLNRCRWWNANDAEQTWQICPSVCRSVGQWEEYAVCIMHGTLNWNTPKGRGFEM